MELWKDILDFEGFYQGSDYGRARSLGRVVPHPRGGSQAVKGRILKPSSSKSGHLRVVLYKLGIKSYLLIPRLVLQTFVGPCPEGMECCHNDGNPANNRLENLRWDTLKNNHLDRVRHGTSLAGERNGRAKLTDKKVKEIRDRLESGETQISIAKDFEVTYTAINKIYLRKTWKHLTQAEV